MVPLLELISNIVNQTFPMSTYELTYSVTNSKFSKYQVV